MKIYRTGYYSNQESSEGFEFFLSKKHAEKALAAWKRKTGNDFDERSSVDFFDTQISAKGIIEILNQVASAPQNG